MNGLSTPRGYHILMPPGWQRYRIDEDGKRALTRQLSQRMKQLSRPDLDVQARILVDEQWRRLQRARAEAVFLPSESGAGVNDGETRVAPPVSIAMFRHTSTSFESSFASMVRQPVVRFETPNGVVLRSESVSVGDGELAELTSHRIVYGFPWAPDDAPEPPQRGLVLQASVPSPAGADPQLVRAAIELCDTIMETFRWT